MSDIASKTRPTRRPSPSRGWPQLFASYRKVLRWLADPAQEDLSDYMLASNARTLVEEVTPDLQFAGIAIDARPNDSTYLDTCADLAESR